MAMRVLQGCRSQCAQGFGLIETALTILLISLMLVPVLTMGTGSVVKNDVTEITATEQLNQELVSAQNLIAQINSLSGTVGSTVNGSLPTTAGAVVRVPASNATLYNSNGKQVYWYTRIKNMSYAVRSDGSLGNRSCITPGEAGSCATVGTGSAVRTVPTGNDLYLVTLYMSLNSDGSSPYLTSSFYVPKTSCPNATVCPALDTTSDYLIDVANRYNVILE